MPVLLTTYDFFICKFHGTPKFISYPRSIPGSAFVVVSWRGLWVVSIPYFIMAMAEPGKPCSLTSALLTVKNYVLHGLLSAPLVTFLCWFVGVPSFKITHWQEAAGQPKVPVCKQPERWASRENHSAADRESGNETTMCIANAFPLNGTL